MRFSLFAKAAVFALAADTVVASTWGSKAAYNKWHETELERWLSDHDIPYPAASDRKELQNIVKDNWDDKIASPYNSWDSNQLQNYLSTKGYQAKKGTEQNKDSLLSQVKSYWHETGDQASSAYDSVVDWIFDSWTESQLKSFLDYHGIPNPTPRNRDTLLQTARSNYQTVSNKAGEAAAYPGDWLYQSWSESDLKAWLDERGIPAPQTSSRDKLIASVRRNSRTASNKAADTAASVSSSAKGATQSLSDQLLDSWSDSQIKEWADSNGIKVPQGSKRNELIALARKHSARLSGNNVASSASSAYGAATSSAGNQYAQATEGVFGQAKYWYDWAMAKVGMASDEAKASLSSASVQATSSASSASSVASASASSVSKYGGGQAQGSASSASNQASKSGASGAQAATDAVKENIHAATNRAGEAAQQATDRVKEEL